MDKKELLNNPLVKEIAIEHLECYMKDKSAITGDDSWNKYINSQTKPEWKIIMWKSENGQFLKKMEAQYSGWKRCSESGEVDEDEIKIEGLTGYEDKHIYSVRRLSDGVEFKIGDRFEDSSLSNSDMCIGRFEITPKGDMLLKSISGKAYCNILYASAPNKKRALFITEDGKDIFEGDKYYHIFTHKWDLGEYIAKKGCYQKTGDADMYFSTKEAAEEYILMNKPFLISLKEIIDLAFYTTQPHAFSGQKKSIEIMEDKLIQLAKSKMK